MSEGCCARQHAGEDDERDGQQNCPDRHHAFRDDEGQRQAVTKAEGYAEVTRLGFSRGLERPHYKQKNCEHQRQRRQQRIAVSLLQSVEFF